MAMVQRRIRYCVPFLVYDDMQHTSSRLNTMNVDLSVRELAVRNEESRRLIKVICDEFKAQLNKDIAIKEEKLKQFITSSAVPLRSEFDISQQQQSQPDDERRPSSRRRLHLDHHQPESQLDTEQNWADLSPQERVARSAVLVSNWKQEAETKTQALFCQEMNSFKQKALVDFMDMLVRGIFPKALSDVIQAMIYTCETHELNRSRLVDQFNRLNAVRQYRMLCLFCLSGHRKESRVQQSTQTGNVGVSAQTASANEPFRVHKTTRLQRSVFLW